MIFFNIIDYLLDAELQVGIDTDGVGVSDALAGP